MMQQYDTVWNGNRYKAPSQMPPEGHYKAQLRAFVPWEDKIIFMFDFEALGGMCRAGLPIPNNWTSERFHELLKALGVRPVLGKQVQTSRLLGLFLHIKTANIYSEGLRLFYIKVVEFEPAEVI